MLFLKAAITHEPFSVFLSPPTGPKIALIIAPLDTVLADFLLYGARILVSLFPGLTPGANVWSRLRRLENGETSSFVGSGMTGWARGRRSRVPAIGPYR